MSYSSGEAAEQVVRMTLNGVEVAAKISGKAADIFDRTVQAVDGDNTCISHPALPLFLYQMPCCFGKTQHFLNALLTCHSRSIGNMGKLIGIVA